MEPLIYTSKGNVPMDSLTYETVWDDQPAYTKFIERYRDASGEVVKESAHIYSKHGVFAVGVANDLASA